MRIYYHCLWGQSLNTCSNATEIANEQLLVAVDHNQIRILASATVDPIDWTLPPSLYKQYPLNATCTVQVGVAPAGNRTGNLLHTRKPPCLYGHSGYKRRKS